VQQTTPDLLLSLHSSTEVLLPLFIAVSHLHHNTLVCTNDAAALHKRHSYVCTVYSSQSLYSQTYLLCFLFFSFFSPLFSLFRISRRIIQSSKMMFVINSSPLRTMMTARKQTLQPERFVHHKLPRKKRPPFTTNFEQQRLEIAHTSKATCFCKTTCLKTCLKTRL